MKARAGALCAALVAAAATAHAEEGLFTLRAAGGVSTVARRASRAGGSAQAGWTLGWTDAIAVTTTLAYVGHATLDAASLGAGLRLQADLSEWTHPFALVEPSVLLLFDAPDTDPLVLDGALRLAVGVDYLLLWGLGVVIEASGTLPAGLGRLSSTRTASVALTCGFYVEL